MSIILKKPFIQTVLESLTSDQLNRILFITNGGVSAPTKVRLWDDTAFAALKSGGSETGINYITLEALPGKKNSGILVYTNDYCILFIINGWNVQQMGILNINPETKFVNDIEEDINIGDFRRTLLSIIGSSDLPEYTTTDKDKVLRINSTGTGTEWGFAPGFSFTTTAPTAANTTGDLKIVVLNAEPATYYDGYYYIITEE